MSKVAIVTDSTAYIPKEVIGNNPISVLPLQCIFGEEIFRDGVDITPNEFYTRLKTTKVLPTTSQVTPNQFQETYSGLLNEGYDILSLHISSKLSGTIILRFRLAICSQEPGLILSIPSPQEWD